MIPFNVQLPTKRVRVILFRRARRGPLVARWWWKGKQYSKTTGHEFPKDAQTRARAMVEEVAGQVSRTPLTLRQAVDLSVKERWPDATGDNRKHSMLTYERFVADAGEHLNVHALRFDDAKHAVQRYLDMRKKTLGPQSLINEQRHLSRLFSWLEQRGHVQWQQMNPASRKALKDLPRVHHRPRPPVSPHDLAILLKAARKKTIWPTVLLCLTAGMRCAGTLRLKWSDLNFDTGRLRVFEKNVERYIPLDEWTLDELRKWKRKGVDAEYIVGRDSRLMWHHIQQIRRTHALGPEVTMQGCRRTFISMCLDAGVSAELVASLCGNSVAVIEKHYKDFRTMNADHVPKLLKFGELFGNRSKTVARAKS